MIPRAVEISHSLFENRAAFKTHRLRGLIQTTSPFLHSPFQLSVKTWIFFISPEKHDHRRLHTDDVILGVTADDQSAPSPHFHPPFFILLLLPASSLSCFNHSVLTFIPSSLALSFLYLPVAVSLFFSLICLSSFFLL